MKQLLHNPWAILGAYWAFSAMVSGMPAPDSSSGIAYRWAFKSLNMFAANVSTAAAKIESGASPLAVAAAQGSSQNAKTSNSYSDLGR